jgi:hypothetical protein
LAALLGFATGGCTDPRFSSQDAGDAVKAGQEDASSDEQDEADETDELLDASKPRQADASAASCGADSCASDAHTAANVAEASSSSRVAASIVMGHAFGRGSA